MYLAQVRHRGRLRYLIRKSFFDEDLGIYGFDDVFDLGENPTRYFHRYNDTVLYFDESLEDAIARESDEDATTLLEQLLWDFLPREVRRIIRDFGRRNSTPLSPLSRQEKEEVDRAIHVFDRRRIYYVRYGAVDQSRIYRLNDKLYRPLLYKSRDEKEYYFKKLEMPLKPGELKKYMFAIFNLQKSFTESFSPFLPEALEQPKMEKIFLEKLCRLNDDAGFWEDGRKSGFLRDHLVNYLIYFFDYDFANRSFMNDFFREFRARHTSFRWPEKKVQVSETEINEIFGLTMDDLRKMNRSELGRLFREKAKNHHPDSGGEADDFIKLRQVYENLKNSL